MFLLQNIQCVFFIFAETPSHAVGRCENCVKYHFQNKFKYHSYISPNAAFFFSMSSFLKLGNDDFAPVYFRSSAAVLSYIIDDFFVFWSLPTTLGKFQVIPAYLFINLIWRRTSLRRFLLCKSIMIDYSLLNCRSPATIKNAI